MAKLRMTYKNLKALRKSKEYQAVLVDLVNVGVVSKAIAEGLLGYNIPANLIIDDESAGTDDPVTDPTDPTDPTETATVTLLYFNSTANDNAGEWETAEYDLTGGHTATDILNFAKTEFSDDTLNSAAIVEEDPEYVEGETALDAKYISLDPQPETLESGMLIQVCNITSAPVTDDNTMVP